MTVTERLGSVGLKYSRKCMSQFGDVQMNGFSILTLDSPCFCFCFNNYNGDNIGWTFFLIFIVLCVGPVHITCYQRELPDFSGSRLNYKQDFGCSPESPWDFLLCEIFIFVCILTTLCEYVCPPGCLCSLGGCTQM